MLVKTNSYKQGDIVGWNVAYLRKLVKEKDFMAFIKEHGQGPFVVMNEYTVHSKDSHTRWLYIRPTDKMDTQDLHMVDEVCLTPFIIVVPVEQMDARV